MREIKFRAWDSKEQKMIYAEDWDTGAVINLKGLCGRTFWKLMQYTGLKDKNGKEMYEGDIVTTDCNCEGKCNSHPGTVIFQDGCFWCCEEPLYENHFLEVIGNIYENPELLEAK